MHEHRLTLQAPANEALHLWIEPWAEGISFPPSSTIDLWALSDRPGELTLEGSSEATAVYGWPGSTLKILFGEHVVASFDTPVPSGLTKENVSLLFGAPPVPTPEERARTVDPLAGLPPNKSWERTREG
jgi:hypothetical protein